MLRITFIPLTICMSRICQLSGKGPLFGNSRSHSNIATRRRQNVNLQTVKIGGKRIRIAARTLRTLKKMANSTKGEK
jgi:large subunit ribosomal protein L28